MQGQPLLRVGALVVWRGQVVAIQSRHVARDCVRYSIHTRAADRSLVMDHHVTIGPLMAELCAWARWSVGDVVELEAATRVVQARWWSTRTGTVMYRVSDAHDETRGGGVVLDQAKLQHLVERWKSRELVGG